MSAAAGSASLAELSLAELSELIRTREVSPVDVTREALERVEKLNPELNLFLTVLEDQAIAQAKALEGLIQNGVYLGPLHGVPIALKDNVETAGVRTTAGSRILAEQVPEQDATVAARLKSAGAIVLGKTHLYEFAAGDFHRDYGEARNPWDTSRCCACSSSGSAGAVAARIAYGAIGSDTGGSIRLPAAVTGVVGLKPTRGLVSRAGVIPMSPTLDCAGPFGRTARDVALQMQAITGPDPRDPSTVDATYRDYDSDANDPSRFVIGVPKRQHNELIEPDVDAAIKEAVRVMEAQGATIVEVDVPNHIDARAVMWGIAGAECLEFHREWVRERPGDYSKGVRAVLQLAEFTPAATYVRAQRVREKFRREYAKVMERVDALMLPVVPVEAWEVGAETLYMEGQGEAMLEVCSRYCPPFNITGQPAVSVPAGFSDNGLPVAFQFVGRHLEDGAMLQLAEIYQSATDWHERTPTALQQLAA